MAAKKKKKSVTFDSIVGKIPLLPDTANKKAADILTWFQRSVNGTTIVGTMNAINEVDATKVYYIHHIHLRVNDSNPVGTVTAWIDDGIGIGPTRNTIMEWHDLGDANILDVDLKVPLKLIGAVRVRILDIWANPYTLTLIGYSEPI